MHSSHNTAAPRSRTGGDFSLRIAIRCDAGLAIGSGHLMRCLTLAERLRRHGAQVCFICRPHAGHLAQLIEARGFALASLPAAPPGQTADPTPPHASWLGTSWQCDAEQSLAALHNMGHQDWLIVDHYGIDGRWQSRLRPAVGRIMVIDDLADRAHHCDILLDQNLLADFEHRYDNRLPTPCLRLLGPRYALLQAPYASLHARLQARLQAQLRARLAVEPAAIKTVLIYFGGVDRDNLTGCAIDAILGLQQREETAAVTAKLAVQIVPAASGLHAAAVRGQIAGNPQFRLHDTLPTLAPLMMQADLAIGAAGASSWERLCLGLPALVFTLAENQVPLATELASKKFIHWLGSAAGITRESATERIAGALQSWLGCGAPAEADTFGTLSTRAAMTALVDGKGCARVAAALLEYRQPLRRQVTV